MLPLATVVSCSVTIHATLLHRRHSHELEVDERSLDLTFHSSSDLFSVAELTFLAL